MDMVQLRQHQVSIAVVVDSQVIGVSMTVICNSITRINSIYQCNAIKMLYLKNAIC